MKLERQAEGNIPKDPEITPERSDSKSPKKLQERITSTKKSACILEVNLNNQNLVLNVFWDNRVNGWKLFPYYDKTKSKPAFNQPKQSYQQGNDMDDQLPQSEKKWGKSDFNPDEYEQQLSQNDYK